MPKSFNSIVYDFKKAFSPEIINGMCIGYFRLSPIYQGIGAPFGFDWVRTGDAKDYVRFDEPYEKHVGNYHPENKEFIPNPEMYAKLCESYPIANIHIFPSSHGRRSAYHVPVLSIYPYSGKDRDVAALILDLHITKSPSQIRMIYNTEYFEIIGLEDIPTTIGEHKVEISIKCIQEFSEDEFIRLESVNSKGKRKNSGLIRICKNAKNYRREVSILLVSVKYLSSDQEDAIPLVGNVNEAQGGITHYLRQALINPVFDRADLNLGYQEEICQRVTIVKGNRYLIIKRKIKNEEGRLIHDRQALIEPYLSKHLEKIRNIDNFNIIVFCLGDCLMGAVGDVNEILSGHSTEQFVSLKTKYKGSTACHETLHTLGLAHTFKSINMDGSKTDFTYEQYKTDNLMDYSHRKGIRRVFLWEWQWKIIRTKGYPET